MSVSEVLLWATRSVIWVRRSASSVVMAIIRCRRLGVIAARTLASAFSRARAARRCAGWVSRGSWLLVTRVQPAQVGVDPVGDAGAFGDELLAVVHQDAQVGRQPGHRPDRWQVVFPGGDPGDRDRVDRVGLALS